MKIIDCELPPVVSQLLPAVTEAEAQSARPNAAAAAGAGQEGEGEGAQASSTASPPDALAFLLLEAATCGLVASSNDLGLLLGSTLWGARCLHASRSAEGHEGWRAAAEAPLRRAVRQLMDARLVSVVPGGAASEGEADRAWLQPTAQGRALAASSSPGWGVSSGAVFEAVRDFGAELQAARVAGVCCVGELHSIYLCISPKDADRYARVPRSQDPNGDKDCIPVHWTTLRRLIWGDVSSRHVTLAEVLELLKLEPHDEFDQKCSLLDFVKAMNDCDLRRVDRLCSLNRGVVTSLRRLWLAHLLSRVLRGEMATVLHKCYGMYEEGTLKKLRDAAAARGHSMQRYCAELQRTAERDAEERAARQGGGAPGVPRGGPGGHAAGMRDDCWWMLETIVRKCSEKLCAQQPPPPRTPPATPPPPLPHVAPRVSGTTGCVRSCYRCSPRLWPP